MQHIKEFGLKTDVNRNYKENYIDFPTGAITDKNLNIVINTYHIILWGIHKAKTNINVRILLTSLSKYYL